MTGRPRSGVTASETVTIRLRADEKAALQVEAARAGVRPSRLLRRMVRELANGAPDYFDDGLTETRAAHRELAAIGRNLNQLAKMAQRGEHFAVTELGDELRDVAAQVEAVRCLYRDALDKARKRSVAYVEMPS